MVGHDVEYQSHAVFVQSCHKAIKVFYAADFRVERVVVDDVVSVNASCTRFQAWGNIAMADSQRGKIRNDVCRLVESKIAVELQAISRARDVRNWLHDSTDHTAHHAGSIPRMRV